MKFIKWKILLLTCVVSLLPILPAVAVWNKLPEMLPIHFDMNNNADNFASKGFAVLGIPLIVTLLQSFCCIASDMNVKKHGKINKLDLVVKWIVPMISVALQIVIIGIGLGWNIDVRAVAAVLIGVVSILIGIYLPEVDYVKNSKMEPQAALKINRFMGYALMVMGVLFIISISLPPIATIVCVILLIFCGIAGTIYEIKMGRK